MSDHFIVMCDDRIGRLVCPTPYWPTWVTAKIVGSKERVCLHMAAHASESLPVRGVVVAKTHPSPRSMCLIVLHQDIGLVRPIKPDVRFWPKLDVTVGQSILCSYIDLAAQLGRFPHRTEDRLCTKLEIDHSLIDPSTLRDLLSEVVQKSLYNVWNDHNLMGHGRRYIPADSETASVALVHGSISKMQFNASLESPLRADVALGESRLQNIPVFQ